VELNLALFVFDSDHGLFLFERFQSLNPRARFVYRVSDNIPMMRHHPLLVEQEEKVLPRFDLEQFLSVLERERITKVFVAPPVVVVFAKHPAVAGRDLSAVTSIVSAAAPLDAEVAAIAADRLGVPITQAYGMTVRREIEQRAGRNLSIGAIYSTLERLEAKGYVSSRTGEATAERGGRAKRHFQIEADGVRAVKASEDAIRRMSAGLRRRWENV